MSTEFARSDQPTDSRSSLASGKQPHKSRRVLAICLSSLAVAGLVAIAFNVGDSRADQKAAENPVVTTISVTATSRITAPTPAPVTVTAAALPAVTVTAPAPAAVTVTAPAPPATTITITAPPVTVAAGTGSGSSNSGDLSDLLSCEADSMALSDAGDYTAAVRKLAECGRMTGN